MAEVTITSGTMEKHSAGDQTKVVVDVTNIVNGYTLTVNHLRNIEDWYGVATTAEVIGGAKTSGTNNQITFVTGSTLAGRITVYGR